MDDERDWWDREPQEDEGEAVEGELVHETEKAWLLRLPDGREEWFPKSQCRAFETTEDGKAVLVCPTWLCLKKGLLGHDVKPETPEPWVFTDDDIPF